MTRRLLLQPRAESDLRSAFEWYERRQRGLGREFLATVGRRLDEVQAFPEAHPIVYRNIRRAVVSRFPYVIFYIVRPATIAVLAILHHARNPAHWPG
ncbi:MAG TPA: type II toxin-antitoxin system RelE/ParE family toxin [Burkholderiales bacterium]